jgi:hypothetical protein
LPQVQFRQTLVVPHIEVDRSLPGLRVVRVLDRLAETNGLPEILVMDNGLPQKSRRHSFSDLTWSAFEADARRQAVPPVRNHTLTIVTQGQRSSICPDTASQSVAFQVEGPSIIYEVACASTALGEGILPPGLIASGKRR